MKNGRQKQSQSFSIDPEILVQLMQESLRTEVSASKIVNELLKQRYAK